jgi:hypothetical protein
MYERWSKQQKRRVPVTGTAESRASRFEPGMADRCSVTYAEDV